MESDLPKDNNASAEAAPPSGSETGPLPGVSKELEAALAQATEYREGWQRERAEFANYKRRMEKEQADLRQNTAGKVIARYLDVLDDFDRAMQDQPGEGASPEAVTQWAAGITLIHRKFQKVLDDENVTRLVAEGQHFDPNLHEAVTHEDSADHESGQVIAVLRQGYKIGDRVIRPALVRVAK
jgi:molecular chaperone GrpE